MSLQFSCFVEGCERQCLTPQKRRMHLIDKHMYPRNFFFAITRDGVDGRRSLLLEGAHHRRRSSTTTKDSRRRSLAEAARAERPEAENDSSEAAGQPSSGSKGKDGEAGSQSRRDVDMDELAGAMSALQFVPPSVRFGRGGGKAGFSKR